MSLDPPPRDKLIEFTREGKPTWNIASRWLDYLLNRDDTIASAALRLVRVFLTGQSASIAPTILNTGSLSAREVRVSYFARVTTPGSVSSSLQIKIGFTRNAVNCVFTFAADTTNTTGSVQGEDRLIPCDAGTNLTYEVVYASAGGTAMEFEILLIVEGLN